MATVVWLGEGPDGPQEMKWAGKTFKVGEAVELEDEFFVEKAKNNRYFKVGSSEPPKAQKPPLAAVSKVK